MVNHLFAAFDTHVDEYLCAKKYWGELCQEVIRRHSEVQDWRPWLNTHFAGGTLMEPGNPIHHLRSESLRKAIRVIQVPPTTDKMVISTWVDNFETDSPERTVWDELVIHCELSDESADEARRVLTDWVKSK